MGANLGQRHDHRWVVHVRRGACGERGGAIGQTGVARGQRRRGQPGGSAYRVDGELGGPLVGSRHRGVAASGTGPVRRLLQLPRDALIGTERGGGQVPDAPVGGVG
ncbi:hypothetical protein ACIBOV_28040 [Micromonospora chersina]|uniref:hypothetical protein n=1 Tax=Micromonospora chersina TaxID=47854 RepID=UPI0037996771